MTSVVSRTCELPSCLAPDDHGVVQLDVLARLQPGDGEQELLRPQPVLEGDDEQLAVVRRLVRHGRSLLTRLGAVVVLVVTPVAQRLVQRHRGRVLDRDLQVGPGRAAVRGPSAASAAMTARARPCRRCAGSTSTAMTPSQPSSTAPRPTATTRPSRRTLGEPDPVVAGQQCARRSACGALPAPVERQPLGTRARRRISTSGRRLGLVVEPPHVHGGVVVEGPTALTQLGVEQPRAPRPGPGSAAAGRGRRTSRGPPRAPRRAAGPSWRSGRTELARRVKPWSARSSQPPSSLGRPLGRSPRAATASSASSSARRGRHRLRVRDRVERDLDRAVPGLDDRRARVQPDAGRRRRPRCRGARSAPRAVVILRTLTRRPVQLGSSTSGILGREPTASPSPEDSQ